MYRYPTDKVVTYTAEDLVLFRDSPFACWMERLTLENPGHGIPPDAGFGVPQILSQRQDDVADTLRAEGRDVTLIDWDQDEPARRAASLEAMYNGADFIVNAQLAQGAFSGAANLLMRTSGYSELGDILYIPCDTQVRTTLHSQFRLCFLADLLQDLQGQLPPQMLIIRGDSDLLPLQTEDHIFYYRAVKKRFVDAMESFRKHRMPDPAESAQFGRWSDCANEVLKQRALAEQSQSRAAAPTRPEVAEPQLIAEHGPSLYDLEEMRESQLAWPEPGDGIAEAEPYSTSPEADPKLAPVVGIADAEMISGETPEQKRDRPAKAQQHGASPDVAAQEVSEVGNDRRRSLTGLGETGEPQATAGLSAVPGRKMKPHPLDAAGSSSSGHSVVDLDIVPATSADASMNAADQEGEDEADDTDRDSVAWAAEPEDEFETDTSVLSNPFNDSLITNDHYRD